MIVKLLIFPIFPRKSRYGHLRMHQSDWHSWNWNWYLLFLMFFGPFPLCVAGGPRLVPYSFFLCFWDLFPPSCCRWAEQESCWSNQLHDHDQRYNRCTFKSQKSNKFTFSPQHKLNSTGSQFLCPRDAKFICKFVKDLVFAQFSHWHPPPVIETRRIVTLTLIKNCILVQWKSAGVVWSECI